MFNQQSQYSILEALQAREIKHFNEQRAMIFLFQVRQHRNTLLRFYLLISHIMLHIIIPYYRTLTNSRRQHQALKTATTAQCHIHLTGSKRAASIDDGTIESQSLTLMNGYCPSQTQRILLKLSEHLSLYLLSLLVHRVALVLPSRFLHHYRLRLPHSQHTDFLVVGINHMPNHTIII